MMKKFGEASRITVFYVRDLSRSLDFYRHLFGARVEHYEPGLFVQLLIRQQSLRLVSHPRGTETSKESREFRIDVPDLDHFIRRLEGTSTPHRERHGPSGTPVLTLNDPDGNRVILVETPIERLSQK